MEENQSLINRTHQKLDEFLGLLHSQKEDMNRLRDEVTVLKAENEAKSNEISSLYDELANKERELEGVVHRIEEALGGAKG